MTWALPRKDAPPGPPGGVDASTTTPTAAAGGEILARDIATSSAPSHDHHQVLIGC